MLFCSVGHVQVKDNFIRMQFFRLLDCLRQRRGFTDDRNVFAFAQQMPNRFTHYLRVFRQKHPDAHSASVRTSSLGLSLDFRYALDESESTPIFRAYASAHRLTADSAGVEQENVRLFF